MSRTGPGYVESEAELFADLRSKRDRDDLSEAVERAFVDLYEFATEVGDRVDIGGAKNAHFKLKVTSHRGGYSGADPSVFTANVAGKVKVWPARTPMDHGYFGAVPWEERDYLAYQRAFRSLDGVPADATEAPFEILAAGDTLVRFERAVETFVSACRRKTH